MNESELEVGKTYRHITHTTGPLTVLYIGEKGAYCRWNYNTDEGFFLKEILLKYYVPVEYKIIWAAPKMNQRFIDPVCYEKILIANRDFNDKRWVIVDE